MPIINTYLMSDQTQRKNFIRQNLKTLRSSIKDACTKKDQTGSLVWKSSQGAFLQAPVVRRRRKTSQNLKSFETLSVFKDKSISQSFQEFYEQKQKLGEGTQSVVYKCRQLGTDQISAVKVVKQKDLQLMYNLRSCYEILRQLDHECIIKGKYLYMNQKKMTCHMVMQYISYPQLRTFMKEKQQKGQKIDETTVSNIVQSLLDCLSYMSEKGVCHRDIKPENILYDPETGNIKIIDFQIARIQRYSHETLELWSCTGTPSYRAPQTYSKSYGIPVDVWAVGVIAFEMLTGSLPFKTRYASSTAKKICNQEINFNDYALSYSTQSFLKRLLNKDPEKRMTPKQALSHPFILKNFHAYKNSPPLKKRKSCNQNNSDQDSDNNCTPTSYYEEQSHSMIFETLSQDIGVRFCQQ